MAGNGPHEPRLHWISVSVQPWQVPAGPLRPGSARARGACVGLRCVPAASVDAWRDEDNLDRDGPTEEALPPFGARTDEVLVDVDATELARGFAEELARGDAERPDGPPAAPVIVGGGGGVDRQRPPPHAEAAGGDAGGDHAMSRDSGGAAKVPGDDMAAHYVADGLVPELVENLGPEVEAPAPQSTVDPQQVAIPIDNS